MDTLLLLFIVLMAVIGLLLLFARELLFFLEDRCNLLRDFIRKNSGFFTILFLFIFFSQQLALILLSYLLNVDSKIQILIGVFALIILTTAAVEKFVLEKKLQYLQSETSKVTYENQKIFDEYKEISEAYEQLYNKYKKIKTKEVISCFFLSNHLF